MTREEFESLLEEAFIEGYNNAYKCIFNEFFKSDNDFSDLIYDIEKSYKVKLPDYLKKTIINKNNLPKNRKILPKEYILNPKKYLGIDYRSRNMIPLMICDNDLLIYNYKNNTCLLYPININIK